MERQTLYLAGAVAFAVVVAAVVLQSTGGPVAVPDDPNATADTWLTAELVDVRSGETFTVADLEKPVLYETFAVWCSTCLAQQRELVDLHDRDVDVRSVTVNIDPNEDAARVRDHLDRHGFDWRYAVAPTAVSASLREAFGNSILIPPRAPVVLVCADGTRRLPDGVKSADALESELAAGC